MCPSGGLLPVEVRIGLRPFPSPWHRGGSPVASTSDTSSRCSCGAAWGLSGLFSSYCFASPFAARVWCQLSGLLLSSVTLWCLGYLFSSSLIKWWCSGASPCTFLLLVSGVIQWSGFVVALWLGGVRNVTWGVASTGLAVVRYALSLLRFFHVGVWLASSCSSCTPVRPAGDSVAALSDLTVLEKNIPSSSVACVCWGVFVSYSILTLRDCF